MIKCPQCNYHNIDDHRFCQQCGASLTQKTCANCGHLVDLNDVHCSQCQHPTATIWWTIVTPIDLESQALVVDSPPSETASIDTAEALDLDSIDLDLEDEPSTEELLNTIEQLVNEQAEPDSTVDDLTLEVSNLIDSQQDQDLAASPLNAVILRFLEQNPRYQLLNTTALSSQATQANCHEVPILDTQPFHISPLAVMLSQLQGATDATEMSKPGAISHFLETQPLPFPLILEPYLALKQQFPLLLPHVHDAWQSEQQSVVLLENRTGLLTLKQVLATGKIGPAQILHWLQQTLDFAQSCSPWHCLSSVLHADNLKVDQGQILCLQQLLFEKDQPIPIEASGKNTFSQPSCWDDLRYVWLDVLQGLGATLADQFHPLLTNLQSADNVTPTKLQWYLSEQTQRLPSPTDTAAHPQHRGNLDNGGATPTLILPSQLVHLAAAGQTDDGRDRHHNEDFFIIDQQLQQRISPSQHHVSARGLYILCDGMGGHDGGEIASALATETLTQYFRTHWQDNLPDEDTIKNAFYAANQALFQVNEEKAGSNRMGTTAIAALVQDTHVQIAHVGDSRLYRLTHQHGLEQMTVDHEVGQREIQRGIAPEVAYARPDAYQLTQALGPRDNKTLAPDTQLLTVTEDTLFLICSDGLTDNQLLEQYCESHLLPMLNSKITLQQGVNDLVGLANEHNGHDNITVVSIFMKVQPQMNQSR